MPAKHYEIRDQRFEKLICGTANIDVLWTGGRWAEGPAYFPAGRYVIWSDIPNDRILRWDEMNGQVATFEQPCRNHNGHTVDAQGRMIACEHRGRCISRYEPDGSRTILADRHDGKRLNSPNDVVVKSDDTIWFTDPSYGIMSNYEGFKGEQEQATRNVYRLDPKNGSLTVVASDFGQPNGLAFSPDESKLYIADSHSSHDPNWPAHIRSFNVQADGTLTGGEELCVTNKGLPDGFRVDVSGNIWSSAGDGVHCFSPEGHLLGKILVPQTVSNVTFGGPRRNRLFITATKSLYAVYTATMGNRIC
jgi:gluconolactonase